VTALLLLLALSAAGLVIGRRLFVIGMRNGDRLGDATVGAAKPDNSGRGISFAVHNRGPQPVLIGASVRLRRLRLLGETRQSVSVPRRTLRNKLLAGQHTVVGVIPAGETQTVIVPFSRSVPRRAELVVAIGEPDRLRMVRQAVKLSRPYRAGRSRSTRDTRQHSPDTPPSGAP
jgi:hypothetical protein